MTQRLIAGALLLLVAIPGIPGCTSGEMLDDPQLNGVTWRKPKTGSTFTYDVSLTDSTGHAFAGHTQIDTVVAHDTTLRGIDGQVMFKQLFKPDYSGWLVDYRANGDIAIATHDEIGRPIPYRVYPIGSRQPVIRAPWSISDGHGNVSISMAGGTTSYLGSEQIWVGSETLATHKVLEVTDDTTGDGVPYRMFDTLWFAPSIGTLARRSVPYIPGLTHPEWNDGMTWKLSSYSIR
jgi:hypothetical protein